MAEGSHWLATGEVFHVESEPMGRILARLDHLVPAANYMDWFFTPNPDLDGEAPLAYIDRDELEPLEDLLSEMEEKADRLRRFLGPVAERDGETVSHWRAASPEAHAEAMIELAEYAERMIEQTGYGKDYSEMFPGFPRPRFGHSRANYKAG